MMLSFKLVVAALLVNGCLGQQSEPNYQSHPNFNQAYINQMVARPGGYVVKLTTSSAAPCRLDFLNSTHSIVTATDPKTQQEMSVIFSYHFTTATPQTPANLRFSTAPNVMGADAEGNLDAIPLSAHQNFLMVWSTKLNFGEVLVPFEMRGISERDIKTVLANDGISREMLDRLKLHECPL